MNSVFAVNNTWYSHPWKNYMDFRAWRRIFAGEKKEFYQCYNVRRSQSRKLFSPCCCKNRYDILKTHGERDGFTSGRAPAILIRVMKQRRQQQYTDLRRRDLNLNCFGITKDVAMHVGFNKVSVDDFSNSSHGNRICKLNCNMRGVYLTVPKQHEIDVENFSAAPRACQLLFATLVSTAIANYYFKNKYHVESVLFVGRNCLLVPCQTASALLPSASS